MTWTTVRIGDLGRVVTGKTPPSSQPAMFVGDVPFFTPSDMEYDKRDVEPERHVSTDWDPRRRGLLPAGSVCVVCIGATIGKVCMTSRASHTNQQVNSVVVDEERFDPGFVYYSLRTAGDELKAKAAGAATPIINKSSFSEVTIRVPSLETQKRIAAILGAYDDLIEVNRRRVAVLEEMARGLFEEWFVRFRFPGHEDVPLVDTPDGPLPDGWHLSTVGQECKVVLGGTPSRKRAEYWGGEVPWLNSGKANDLRVISASENITELGLQKSSAKMMPQGATIIAITGATLGQVSILTEPMCGNQSLAGVWDETGTNNEYIHRYIQFRIEEVIARASGGAQQHINKGIVEGFVYRAPPRSLLSAYLSAAQPMGSLIGDLLKANARLANSRDLLLPRLISGQLSVEAAERELENAA